MDLSWDQAILNVLEASEQGRFQQRSEKQNPGPLSSSQIIECAKVLRDTNAMPINALFQFLKVTDMSVANQKGRFYQSQRMAPSHCAM